VLSPSNLPITPSIMSVVKSHEWELLSNMVKNEDPNTVRYIFEFLTEETLLYENGQAQYPMVEFAIALALDRNADERKNAQVEPPPVVVTKQKIVEPPSPPTPVLTAESRRQIIRDSWERKFGKPPVPEPEPVVAEPEPEPEPEPESEPTVKLVKTTRKSSIMKNRRAKKQPEPEPE